MSYKSGMFEIENKSIYGQYQLLCDRKLRITWHRQNRKSWSRVRIPRHGPIFHLRIIQIWQMKKNTYMHFKEESIIYIWPKFQLDTCMFDSNILLTKFGPGFWCRVPGVSPGFYSFPNWPYRVRSFVCFHTRLYNMTKIPATYRQYRDYFCLHFVVNWSAQVKADDTIHLWVFRDCFAAVFNRTSKTINATQWI